MITIDNKYLLINYAEGKIVKSLDPLKGKPFKFSPGHDFHYQLNPQVTLYNS